MNWLAFACIIGPAADMAQPDFFVKITEGGFEFFILCSMHLFLLLVFCYLEELITLAYFIFVLQTDEYSQRI
jgi:hypothetical protein